MAEYIEREAAIELLSQPITMSMCLSTEECHHKIAQQRIDRYLIENIPAADVRPVVRGQNIYDTVNGHCEFKCSVCGVELSSVYGGRNDFGLDGGYFNFCPNCGASMEES